MAQFDIVQSTTDKNVVIDFVNLPHFHTQFQMGESLFVHSKSSFNNLPSNRLLCCAHIYS